MEYHLSLWPGQNSYEQAKVHAAQAIRHHCDVIVGVGGGRIMDQAKATGYFAGQDLGLPAGHLPVVEVPTSIATYSAFAPSASCTLRRGPAWGACGIPMRWTPLLWIWKSSPGSLPAM